MFFDAILFCVWVCVHINLIQKLILPVMGTVDRLSKEIHKAEPARPYASSVHPMFSRRLPELRYSFQSVVIRCSISSRATVSTSRRSAGHEASLRLVFRSRGQVLSSDRRRSGKGGIAQTSRGRSWFSLQSPESSIESLP